MDDLDTTLVGRDRLPWLKEIEQGHRRPLDELDDRSLPEHPLGGARPSRAAARRGAREALAGARARAAPRRARPVGSLGGADGRAQHLRGAPRRPALRRDRAARPGNRADRRAAADAHVVGRRLLDRRRAAALPEPPDRRGVHDTGPERTSGHVTSTKPLVLRDGTIIRGLRVTFENGVAVKIDADENAEALRSQLTIDDGALRLGELALVDRQGRIGPLDTVFYDTLLDENAASHIALGSGFPFLVEGDDVARVNTSGTHVDFMIGSPESRRGRRHDRRGARPGAARRRLAVTRRPSCRAAGRPLRARDRAVRARLSKPDDVAALHARARRAATGGWRRAARSPSTRAASPGRSPKDKFLVDEEARTTASGGVRSTRRSARSTSTVCARRWPHTSRRPIASTSSTPGPAPMRRTGSACA